MRWLRSRIVRGGLILLYHRVAVCSLDPYALCVSPGHFRSHMASLRTWAHPMTLPDLVSAARQGTLPPRSVAVTFDDGYADTLHNALPALTECEIPATVFVTTGNPGRPFWWDRVSSQILDASEWPPCLELVAGNQTYRWTVDGSSRRQLHHLLRQVHALCRQLPVEACGSLVRQLEAWSGKKVPDDVRALTVTELKALAATDLVQIGAHTVHHPALSALSPREQLQELQQSRMDLEALVGKAVTEMSYPFGVPGQDYDSQTVQLARQAGYKWACAAYIDVVHAGTDDLQLPRYWVHDWSGEQLIRHLRWWLR